MVSRRLRVLVLAVLCAGVASLGVAPAGATLEGGRAALERHDLLAALREFREAAEAGNAEAQYQLALLYYLGRGGIAEDHAAAAEWFGRAAKQGHAKATMRLGDLYAKGQGVPQDYERARELLRSAVPGLKDAEKRYAESYAVMIDQYLQARARQPAAPAPGGDRTGAAATKDRRGG